MRERANNQILFSSVFLNIFGSIPLIHFIKYRTWAVRFQRFCIETIILFVFFFLLSIPVCQYRFSDRLFSSAFYSEPIHYPYLSHYIWIILLLSLSVAIILPFFNWMTGCKLVCEKRKCNHQFNFDTDFDLFFANIAQKSER